MSGNNSGAMLGGFLLGAIVGGGLSLLFASRTGDETRRHLGEAARRLQDGIRDPLDQVKDAFEEAADEVARTAVGAGKDALSL